MEAHTQGMQLHFISRKTYRRKQDELFIEQLREQFGRFYLIPEGGSNALAVKGCTEIITNADKLNYEVVCCAVGTGGTVSGLINAVADTDITVIGFAALQAPSLLDDIAKFTQSKINSRHKNWQLNFDYTFDGYAKTSSELLAFITNLSDKHDIELEPIYTGKMLFGIYELIRNGYFKRGTRLLALHTGGLQGWQRKDQANTSYE